MEVKGVAADNVMGYARGELAQSFCNRRGLSLSKRFSIELYTFAHAATFARAWCHRMKHFLDLAVESGDLTCVFNPDQVAAYEEPTEFTAAARLLRHTACQKAAKLIRALFT